MKPEPFTREAGTGPGVVCLHANASTSGQWRALMELLAPTHHVLAPDLYGAGKSPEWPSDRVITLADEVAFIAPVLARAGSPLALVGHSYGAAVALLAALAEPGRFRALALFEPTLFALLDQSTSPPTDLEGPRAAVARAGLALDAGDPETAAGHFIGYWVGARTWAATPPERKAPIVQSIRNVRRWGHALFTEPTPLEAFRALTMPVLCMTGRTSPAPAHGVTHRLTAVLPHVEVVEFAEVGHMGPVTHPEVVNAVIARFLGAA